MAYLTGLEAYKMQSDHEVGRRATDHTSLVVPLSFEEHVGLWGPAATVISTAAC